MSLEQRIDNIDHGPLRTIRRTQYKTNMKANATIASGAGALMGAITGATVDRPLSLGIVGALIGLAGSYWEDHRFRQRIRNDHDFTDDISLYQSLIQTEDYAEHDMFQALEQGRQDALHIDALNTSIHRLEPQRASYALNHLSKNATDIGRKTFNAKLNTLHHDHATTFYTPTTQDHLNLTSKQRIAHAYLERGEHSTVRDILFHDIPSNAIVDTITTIMDQTTTENKRLLAEMYEAEMLSISFKYPKKFNERRQKVFKKAGIHRPNNTTLIPSVTHDDYTIKPDDLRTHVQTRRARN
jgi:hypothetical protein